MQYAPLSFKPPITAPSVLNGTPAYAEDAQFVDRYSTWLAAVRKHGIPVSVGTPYDSANTTVAVPAEVYIPPFTTHVGITVTATGSGVLTITNSVDAFNCEMVIANYDDAAHSFGNAQVFHTGPPQANVAADAENRALEVTSAASWAGATFTLSVADESVSKTLKVWAVQYRPLEPQNGNATL